MPDNDTNDAADNDLDFKPKLDGPIRRNLGMILAVVAIIALGPAISRVLTSYRGIVLEVRDDTMLVGLMDLAPKWMDAIDAQPGQVVEKSTGSWGLAEAEPIATDAKLQDLYARYTLTYQGTIVEVLPPASQGGTTSCVVQTDDGKQEVIKLVAEHLLEAGKGDRVEKKIYSWDPVIVAEASDEPGAGTILAPPDGADEPAGEKSAVEAGQ